MIEKLGVFLLLVMLDQLQTPGNLRRFSGQPFIDEQPKQSSRVELPELKRVLKYCLVVRSRT